MPLAQPFYEGSWGLALYCHALHPGVVPGMMGRTWSGSCRLAHWSAAITWEDPRWPGGSAGTKVRGQIIAGARSPHPPGAITTRALLQMDHTQLCVAPGWE